MKLVVPGIIYHEFIEGSGVPIEESWPEPKHRRFGKGWQAIYECDDKVKQLIMSHVECLASCSAGFDADDRGRVAGRRAWKWLESEGWRA